MLMLGVKAKRLATVSWKKVGGGGVGKQRLFPRFQGQIDFGFRRDDLENVHFVRKCKNLWRYITT